MKTLCVTGLCLACVTVWLTGCGGQSEQAGKNGKGTFYWIQPLKGHPVHQMTQIAFKEGCARVGYNCVIVGTEFWDINGTIAMAEQVLAKGDAKGMAIWTGSPAWKPFIEKVGRAKVPVVLPHFPPPLGSPIAGATGVISGDTDAIAREVASVIGAAIAGKGAVAITQGSFNIGENQFSTSFTAAMRESYPAVKVLKPEEEGFDPAKSIAKAAAILQANPDVVAAVSTTGGGPITWAGAQKEAGRKIIAVGMDYTRVNLDLIQRGEVYAVVAAPLWDESFGAAELLATVDGGGRIPWWTRLPAPLITKDRLAPYQAILDKVEAALRK